MVAVPLILIVEDEPAIRRMISKALVKNGYTAREAANGKEALAIAEAHDGEIRLAILDLMMPGLGGLDVANELQLLRPATKILYISGFAGSVAVNSLAQCSPQHLLQKPFTAKRLVEQVRKILEA